MESQGKVREKLGKNILGTWWEPCRCLQSQHIQRLVYVYQNATYHQSKQLSYTHAASHNHQNAIRQAKQTKKYYNSTQQTQET